MSGSTTQNYSIFTIPPLAGLDEIREDGGKLTVISKNPGSFERYGKFMVAPEDFIKDPERAAAMHNVWLPVVMNNPAELFDFETEHDKGFKKTADIPKQAYTLDEIKEMMTNKSLMKAAYYSGFNISSYREAKAKLGKEIEKRFKGDSHVDIRAAVRPVESENSLRAFATITFNDAIAVHDIKVYEHPNAETGAPELKIGMPSVRTKNGEYHDIAFPVTPELRKQITDIVLAEYANVIENGQREEVRVLAPTDTKIRVSGIDDSRSSGNIKASCQITVGDSFVIRDVNIVEGKNGLFAQMPYRQDSNGEYRSVVHAIDKDFSAKLQTAVITKYAERESYIGSASFKELGGKDNVVSSALNPKFAEKVGVQLDEAGVKWFGMPIPNGKTVISVNKNDGQKFNDAVEKARELSKEMKGTIREKLEKPSEQQEKRDKPPKAKKKDEIVF